MELLRPTKIDYALLPAVAATAFLIAPLAVVASNITEFQHLNATQVLLFCFGVASLVAILALLLSAVLLSCPPARTIAPALFRLAFFGSLLSALAFPLATSSGLVEVQQLPVHRLNLVIVSILAVALTIVSYTRFQGGVFAAAFTVLIGSAVSSLAVVATGISPPEPGAQSILEASSKNNVFVLSFDGLPRNISVEVIMENPHFAEALQDFVVFDHLMGSAPATYTSIVSELSGIPNLKESFSTDAEVKQYLPDKRLTTNLLDNNGYIVSTYSIYSVKFGNRDRVFPMGSLTDVIVPEISLSQAVELLDYALARTATRHFAWAGRVFRAVAPLVFGPAEHTDSKPLQRKVAHHNGPAWDTENILTVLDLERYSSELSVATSENVAHFLHFTHTHFPVDFDRTCRYRSDDAEWYLANQTREGLKSQVYCAFTQLAGFVSHLKDIGAYDNALIVLKSDHGEPVGYNDPERYEGFKVREHELWGVGRYLPFLAIKPAGRHQDEMVVDSRNVAMSDLANTICRQTVSSSVDCDSWGTIDLSDPEMAIPEDATYFVYLPTGPDATFVFDTHSAMELSRARQFEVELIDRLTDELVGTKSVCNVQVDVTQGSPNSNGLTDGQSWATWSNGGERFIKISPPACGQSVLEIALDVDESDEVMAEIVGSPSSSLILERKGDGRAILSIEPDMTGPDGLAVTVRAVHNEAPTPPVVTSYIYHEAGVRSGTLN